MLEYLLLSFISACKIDNNRNLPTNVEHNVIEELDYKVSCEISSNTRTCVCNKYCVLLRALRVEMLKYSLLNVNCIHDKEEYINYNL